MNDLVARAADGFHGLAVADARKQAALAALERWTRDPVFADDRPQIEGLVERGAWDPLLDAFHQVLPFGTGGRRGPVGIGPNRIHPWTVATAIQGHAELLRERTASPLVILAYDVRVFRDLAGVYDLSRPNRLINLSSRDFAEIAARVYAANGVRVRLQPRGETAYMATPVLSFAIRHYGADAGIVISASHNPPDDNGVKMYDRRGGQEIPPDDERLVERVAAVTDVRDLSWQRAKDSGLVDWVDDELFDAFARHVAGRSRTSSRSARVAYTALHGTGRWSVVPALERAGFPVRTVVSQDGADGAFPTVPFRAPNPEAARVFDVALAELGDSDVDLVLATDPDADRIGCIVRHDGGWRFLTGNDIAAIVVDHALAGRGGGIVARTEVTTGLVSRIAEAHGAAVIDHLLVGFKYIGDVLAKLEDTGHYGDIEGTVDDFVAGVEESHGVLITPGMRDKDAAGGALFLAEAASLARDRGETLIDALEGLWSTHGFVANKLVSVAMKGAVGRERIESIQASFRASPPASIGGRAVVAMHDRRDPSGPFGPIVSNTDAASRDVLVFDLGSSGRVILRPSGTEPKTKVYVEVRGERGAADLGAEATRCNLAAAALAEAFVVEMLDRVGIRLPSWAHGASELLPIEGRVALAEVIVPGVAARLDAGEAVSDVRAWAAAALAAWGRDAPRLVEVAVARYLVTLDDPKRRDVVIAVFTA